jgi:hypothetical protein
MRYPQFPTQQPVLHFLPFGFCCFLSLMTLFGPGSDPDIGWWVPAFISSLPMCFFYMGAVTTGMQREIIELRSRLDAQNAAEAQVVLD